MPNPSKKIRERIHTKQRAEERYGLSLRTVDIKEIVKLIQRAKDASKRNPSTVASLIRKQSLSRSLWRVEYQGQSLVVVYSNVRHNIVTVLPKDAVPEDSHSDGT